MPGLHARIVAAAIVLLTACTHAGIRGTQPAMQRTPRGEYEIEHETSISAAEITAFADALSTKDGTHLTALWTVPGFPGLRLAGLIRPPAGEKYGPQLVAFRGAEVVHESHRLFDDDFVNPTFFRFGDRTLLLADHGSEDAYGIIAWSFENGGIRDLGVLDVALPEEDVDVFTRGAARYARVERRGDSYLVTIPGPFLVDPRGETEKVIEKTTTFTLPAPR